jgi:chromosomal replication initiator protein
VSSQSGIIGYSDDERLEELQGQQAENGGGGDEPQACLTWENILKNIKERLGVERFGIWFKQTRLMCMRDSCLVIGVPNVIVKQYLEQRYAETVAATASDLLGEKIEVKFDVDPNLFRQTRDRQRRETECRTGEESSMHGDDEAPDENTSGSAHRFDRLVLTESNKLPFLAAQEIATKKNPRFDFLLVMGKNGVGKTALLEAVHHAVKATRSRHNVRCVMAEKWCNDFYHALQDKQSRYQKARAFRKYYRDCDMLIIDGFQFFQGKLAAQKELLHTAKHLRTNGGKLVLSSDTHPHDLEDIDSSLRSLLSGAFWVELIVPARDEMLRFTEQLCLLNRLDASPGVVQLLADKYSETIQDLNAAVNTIASYASLQNIKKVDIGMAREALAATCRMRKRVPAMDDISRAVLEVFPIAEEKLRGKSRARSACRARQIAMYLAYEVTGATLSDIGRYFGGRAHSTVKHSIDKVKALAETNGVVSEALVKCRNKL